VIVFDGKKIPTNRIRRDELQADPVLDLTNVKAGEYDVWVENPDGQISSKEVFRISEVDPTPTLNRMLPFTLYLDEVMVDVAVYGQDFMKGAKLYIDGKEITGALGKVVYRSDTFLLAEINLTDRTKWTTAGNLDAIVENPNGKKSAPFKLTVSYRVPSVTSLIPSSWTNQCDTDVEVQGTNFVKTVQVTIGSQTYKVGSTTHPLTFVSDKLLKFKLIATKLSAGTLKVKVENGPQASTTAPDFIVDSGATNTPYINYVRPSIGQADTVVPIYIYPNSKVTNGSRSFKPGAVVEVNGKKMATQCGLSSLGYCYNITANVDLSGFKAGEYDLHVVNPCGVKSAPVGFAVEAPPTPTVSKITPTFAKIGDKTKITFTGTNFAKAHTLLWNGQTIKTVHKSDKEIETADPIDFASAKLGDINVEIKNANGQTTGVMKFSVINKYAPTITEVSNNVQQRGRVLSDLIIKGTGFVVTSRVTINGKTAPVRFTSPTELKVAGYDATNDNPGIYSIQVRNGSRGSNMYPLTLLPIPGPRIDYINPASIVEGSPSTKFTLYIYGSNFNTTGTPKAAVEFLDPKGKDITNGRYTSSYESTTYMRGSLEVGGLTSGKYVIRVKNPDGTYSNNTIFQITPPPPPVAASLSPAAVFRGTPKQQVLISGSNFATGDEIIFNNNVLAAIPGTVQNGSLIGTINLAGIAYAKDYDVYVRRCVDKPACTKYETTKTLKLYINNPPCSLVNCQTQMPTPEKCDNASNPPVCLPPCTTTADCTKLDAKAPWTCQTGVCK
jgi:hypothetical protein